jgi:hypothetical protein
MIIFRFHQSQSIQGSDSTHAIVYVDATTTTKPVDVTMDGDKDLFNNEGEEVGAVSHSFIIDEQEDDQQRHPAPPVNEKEKPRN